MVSISKRILEKADTFVLTVNQVKTSTSPLLIPFPLPS